MPSYADLRFETARLALRPFRHSDAADLFAIYSDPEVFRHIPVGDWKHIDEAHQRIARDINMMGEGSYIRLAVERSEDARVIGEVLLFNFALEHKRAELGYALARDAWRCGYVGEALPPLVRYGFEQMGLNRIEAVIDPRNAASARVLVRLGFTQEGVQRERYIVRGAARDGGMHSLLRREWEAGRAP